MTIQQTFLSSGAELLSMPPNKFFSFCNCKLPSKRRKLNIAFTPITLKIILCFTPHSSEHKCLCLATLITEQSSNGCHKPVTCTITRTLGPRWRILIRFSSLAFIITKVEVNFRNTSSSMLTLTFIFKFPTLHDPHNRQTFKGIH